MWTQDFVECLERSSLSHSRLDEAMSLKFRNLPDYIYKYRRDSELSRDNLRNGTVWICSPDEYNDPYDCMFKIADQRVIQSAERRFADVFITHYHLEGIVSAEQIAKAKNSEKPLQAIAELISESNSAPDSNPKRMAEFTSTVGPKLITDALSAVRQWRKLTKACSFSAVHDSILMWSHYAGNHTGFCFEYGLKGLASEHAFCKFLYPIIYSEALYDLTPWAESLVHPDRKDFNTECLILTVLYKFAGWQYEHEWRLVEVTQAVIPDHNFPAPTPTRVLLGSRMEQAKRKELLAICREKKIEVHQMHLTADRFELLSEEIL